MIEVFDIVDEFGPSQEIAKSRWFIPVCICGFGPRLPVDTSKFIAEPAEPRLLGALDPSHLHICQDIHLYEPEFELISNVRQLNTTHRAECQTRPPTTSQIQKPSNKPLRQWIVSGILLDRM